LLEVSRKGTEVERRRPDVVLRPFQNPIANAAPRRRGFGGFPFVALAVGGAGFVDGQQGVVGGQQLVFQTVVGGVEGEAETELVRHTRIDVAAPHRAGGDKGGGFAGFCRADEHDGGLLQLQHRGDRR
jgi:hypothetical protein